MTKKLYIETVGCQMNVLDSELVVASLRKHDYELTDNTDDADTILFNTCSVRQHAEDKIYSALGRLKNAKQSQPHKIIGVLGCMAQKDQRLIFERAPYVDLIVGPGQLHQVPELIRSIEAGSGPQLEVSLGRKDGTRDKIERSHESFDPLRDPAMRPTPYQAYVRIQIGCDKFCTYCIVPSVRGPEQSRPPQHILSEARQLADEGCKEIILLGQTVNSYRYRESDEKGKRETRLSDLLYALHEIDGIERIKFVTNYPKDMTDDLLEAVRDLPKCAKYLHVPVQSASNRVLQRMKRGYTVEEYLVMMDRIREWLPEAAVTSDFIVGFCGETEDDFQLTCELLRQQRFKNSFIFKYSERPGTKGAEHYPDDVPEAVKKRRNQELLAIQNVVSEEDNQRFLGRNVSVLIEGPSKSALKKQEANRRDAGERDASERDASQGDAGQSVAGVHGTGQPSHGQRNGESQQLQLTGRTMCDRIVVFEGNRRQIGQTLPVTIYDANAHTLFGSVVTQHVGPELFSLSN